MHPLSVGGFSATRQFRGSVLRITVRNPERVCKGVVKVLVDGEPIQGNLVPPAVKGSEHLIEVWLGK